MCPIVILGKRISSFFICAGAWWWIQRLGLPELQCLLQGPIWFANYLHSKLYSLWPSKHRLPNISWISVNFIPDHVLTNSVSLPRISFIALSIYENCTPPWSSSWHVNSSMNTSWSYSLLTYSYSVSFFVLWVIIAFQKRSFIMFIWYVLRWFLHGYHYYSMRLWDMQSGSFLFVYLFQIHCKVLHT